MFEYYRSLIALRKATELFRLDTTQKIQDHMRFYGQQDVNLLLFSLRNDNDCFVVAINPHRDRKGFCVPEDIWNSGKFYIRLSEKGKIIRFPLKNRSFYVEPVSLLVLRRIRQTR